MAELFVSPSDPRKAATIALQLLELKIGTYELFNATFPGYAGFMPWVNVSDAPISPLGSWMGSVPALDNGELIWSIYAVAKALPKSASSLAARYWNYFEYLAHNAIPVFYAGQGHIRTVATIANVSAPPSQNNYTQACTGDCYLDDPYEGELFAVMMDLYSPWTKFNYSANEPDNIWIAKRAKLQSVTYQSKRGPITVQRGWWFSSHEVSGVFIFTFKEFVKSMSHTFSNGSI